MLEDVERFVIASSGAITIKGATTINSTLTAGATTINGNISIGGVATIGNTISLNRDASSGAILSASQSALKVECYSNHVKFNVYKGDASAVHTNLELNDNGASTFNGDVRINGNLVVAGDISA